MHLLMALKKRKNQSTDKEDQKNLESRSQLNPTILKFAK